MKNLLLAMGLVIGASPAVLALASNCIKPGQTVMVHVPLPTLGVGSGTGLPTSAVWMPGDAKAFDEDFWSPDDPLPGAMDNGSSVSVPVTGAGGKLVDANGSIIDHGLEGGCIEVYVTKVYSYSASTSACITLSGGVAGGQVCADVELSIKGTYKSPPIKVRPC